MDDAVRTYIDAIDPAHRPLFDRSSTASTGWCSRSVRTLKTSKGTIRLRPEDAAGISDDELRDLVRTALSD